MKNALLALALCLNASAHAAVPAGMALQPLYTQTNDHDSNVDVLNLMVDTKGTAQGVIVITNGDKDGADPLWMKDIERSEGATLIEGEGRRVVILQGQLDRATQEGRLHVRYLANGLTNAYETCDMLLKKNGGAWFLQNAYTGQKITKTRIVTWTLGLKPIEGICR